jgi:hypothetical protein
MTPGRPGRLVAACAAALVLVFVGQNAAMAALGILRWQASSQALAGGVCRAPVQK